MASSTSAASRRRRRNQKGVVVATATVIIGVGIGVGVAKAQGSSGPDYRTAVATTGTATRTLTVSGTVEPVNQTQASFQVAGSVAAVKVAVGQHVSAGQTLATLDTTSLQQQVSQAQADLDSAQAKLTEDESGQSSSSSNSSSPTSSSSQAQTTAAATTGSTIVLTAASTSSSPTGSTQPTAADGREGSAGNLQQAQQAVVQAQHNADLDLQSAAAALTAAEHTCATSTQSGGSASSTSAGGTHSANLTSAYFTLLTSTSSTAASSAPTPSTSTPATTTPSTTTPTTTPQGSTTPPSGNTSACAAALQTAMAGQQQVSRDQQSVQSAETALAQILSSESSAGSKTSSPSGATNGSPAGAKGTPSSGSNGNPSGSSKGLSSSGGSSSTPTTTATNSAAQLASDQATIDSDQASLISTQQALNNGTLTAPMAGTVAAVDLSVGQSVSAGTSSDSITITDPGAYQTTSSLSSSQVGEVTTGDHVQVTVDGQSGTVSGTVTRVGPVDTSSSGYTYPLVVALTAGSFSPNTTVAGSDAQVEVDIAHASHTVVVPTSAVHTTSTGNVYVTTLQSGHEARTTVKVGVVGDTYTQITSGLSAGTQVVLADTSQPVPSSSSNSTNTFRGIGGTGGVPSGFPTGVSGFTRSGLG